MGVRPHVQLTARPPGPTGHVTVAVDFGRNERGMDGFDPAAELDGLEFALRHPSHAAEYVWNRLLSPNWPLIAGVVERSVLMSFADASRETVRSAIGVAAQDAAWLPHPDGTFRRPAELSVDELPPAFTGTSNWPRPWACRSRWCPWPPAARPAACRALGPQCPPRLGRAGRTRAGVRGWPVIYRFSLAATQNSLPSGSVITT